jgi:heparin binding hemagglutinin HbhA
MGQQDFKEAADRVEGYVDQAVELTQEALGNVSAQTRAVGERAAKLVGVDLPVKKTPARKAIKKAVKKAVKKALPRKAPARKAPAKAVKRTVKRTVKLAPAKRVTQK